MGNTAREFFEAAVQLDPLERVALIEMLVESLDPDPEDGAEASWLRELDRRIAELDTGGVKSLTWKELRDRLVSG
jgi:putative addiction module component (TIGR02574 family)